MRNQREQMIEIFEDTLEQCRINVEIQESIVNSVKNQIVFLEGEKIGDVFDEPGYQQNVKIVVSKKRSLEAAAAYVGKRVCVLNFASATNVGGGVTKGSSAQEEAICRCSALYPCLNRNEVKNKYHNRHQQMLKRGDLNALYNDDCIYTPDVMVIKSDVDYPEILPDKERFFVDIISASAPNLRRSKPDSPFAREEIRVNDSKLKEIHAKRMRRILEIARAKKVEVLVLGAFGCGAFENNPYLVVEGIYEAIKEYRRCFEIIEFAVYCTPRDTRNYTVFNDFLKSNKVRNFL